MNWNDVFQDIQKWMAASNEVMRTYPLTSSEYWRWLVGSLGHLEQKYNSHPLVVNLCIALFDYQDRNYKAMESEGMSKLRLDYYKGKNGDDLFWFFETFLPKQWVIGFYVLNVIKYVVRHEGKNGVEDLGKAKTYVERLVEFEKGGS
nr:DUF3310 domain-containing protein [Liquorilactobacillus satsumensis]